MVPKEKWSDDRLHELDKKVDVGFAKADERFNVVDERFDVIDERFKEVDKRFDKVDVRFKEVEGKIDTLDAKFDKKFDRLTYCIITTLIASLAALIGPNVL